jgi:type III pantothenate kinase
MMRALWRGTADLATHTATSGAAASSPFADNTRDAIERGCRLAVAALVDRSVGEITRRTGTEPRVLLTGGAAPAVAHLLETAADTVPDLVLRGLAMVAGEGSAG